MDTKESSALVSAKINSANRFYRRRLQDVRIWKHICSRGLERAAIRLCRGYDYICHGGRMHTSSWTEKISRSYNLEGNEASDEALEFLARCKSDYLDWVEECRHSKVNSRAVIEILFFGRGMVEVERFYRRRHGWALTNLLQALELYRK